MEAVRGAFLSRLLARLVSLLFILGVEGDNSVDLRSVEDGINVHYLGI